MFRKSLHTLTSWISDAVGPALLQATLPSTCAGCGRAGPWICNRCEPLIAPDDDSGCRRCGRRGPYQHQCAWCTSLFPPVLNSVRAGFAYAGPMRRAVHRFKYGGEFQRGHDLGERLGQRISQLFPTSQFDLIVPVPLHPRRYRSRGFNQAAILADAVAGVVDAPVVSAVQRIRHTTPQVHLSASRRLGNLIGAFELHSQMTTDDLTGKTVLIIDDVTTSGATLSAVAEALQCVEGITVHGLALAREQ